MKNLRASFLYSHQTLFLCIVLGVFSFSCSSDDGFDNANGEVAKKYITKITVRDDAEAKVSTVTYDNDGRVTTATSENKTKYFTYDDNGKLLKISGDGENLMTSEITSEIHDAYEIGDVLEYDENGNPKILELYDENYDGNRITHTAHLTYDNNPFAFYYTLDAAGIIDMLSDVRFRFIAPPEVLLAKRLLPVHNPIKAIIRDESNAQVASITVDFVYNEHSYPVSATVVSLDEEGYGNTYTVSYQYR